MIRTDDMDYSDYSMPSFVRFLPRKEDAIYIFVHEIMHQLQTIYLAEDGLEGASTHKTIGDIILNEGGANFFAEVLLQGEHTNSGYERARSYYQKNPQVMEEMLAAKDEEIGDDESVLKQWFFNGDRVPEGVPQDMGYFLGSVIAYASLCSTFEALKYS